LVLRLGPFNLTIHKKKENMSYTNYKKLALDYKIIKKKFTNTT